MAAVVVLRSLLLRPGTGRLCCLEPEQPGPPTLLSDPQPDPIAIGANLDAMPPAPGAWWPFPPAMLPVLPLGALVMAHPATGF